MAMAAAAAAPLPFFDPHFHVWDLSAQSTSGHEPSNLPVPSVCEATQVYGRAEYEAEFAGKLPQGLQHCGGAFLETVSVCHAGLTGPQYSEHCLSEAKFAQEQLAGGDYVLVPACALEQPDAAEVLAKLAQNQRVRGVRQILNLKPSWPRNDAAGELLEQEAWRKGFAELSKLGLSFDLQLNPHQMHTAVGLLQQHPETIVIIDHLGTPRLQDLTAEHYWKGMELLAALPNTYMKLSYLCGITIDFEQHEEVLEAVHRVVRLFTPMRCMFASNYPMDTMASFGGWTADRLFAVYLRIAEVYSEAEQRELWAGTARRAYRVGT